MQKQDNFVRLSGRIVNRYDRGKVTILTLSVAEMVRKEVKINYPKVYFFHEDKTGAEEFLVKDEVSIIAHVATPRKIRQSNGQEYISQALVGDSIEKRKGMYELLNIPDAGRGPLEPQMNSFIITGTLSSIRKTGDRSAQIVVDTMNDSHINFVSINVATPEAFNMQIGNRVTVIGKVVTGFNEPKNDGEKRTYYQNLVGLSIRKTDTKDVKPVAKEEVTFN
ncbi:MAG: hypothetical protein IJO13_05445 [Lachnospiraceae bacterium]|nr:hypothetical protein [Lachnospiraceae bacterium]